MIKRPWDLQPKWYLLTQMPRAGQATRQSCPGSIWHLCVIDAMGTFFWDRHPRLGPLLSKQSLSTFQAPVPWQGASHVTHLLSVCGARVWQQGGPWSSLSLGLSLSHMPYGPDVVRSFHFARDTKVQTVIGTLLIYKHRRLFKIF